MNLEEAQHFVAQFISGVYTPGDYADFLRWVKGATVTELNEIADTHEAMHGNWVLPAGPSAAWITCLEEKLDSAGKKREEWTGGYEAEKRVGVVAKEGEAEESVGVRAAEGEERVPVVQMRSRGLNSRKVWMVAASIVLLLSAGAYLYMRRAASGSDELLLREKALSRTFSNPRGGGLKALALEDGSKIWLNAASTLKYPPQFTGSERVVELSGEAFFEVAGNSGRPFRVLIKDAEVEVLGTQFDVMAYDDEPLSRTTLVEGAIQVVSGEQQVRLKPRQQAEIHYPSPGAGIAIHVQSDIDPAKALAWKNGSDDFFQTDLRTIMREVARAYNVVVRFDPNTPNPDLNVAFSRADGLDKALKLLENSVVDIQFKTDGKTVIVTPI